MMKDFPEPWVWDVLHQAGVEVHEGATQRRGTAPDLKVTIPSPDGSSTSLWVQLKQDGGPLGTPSHPDDSSVVFVKERMGTRAVDQMRRDGLSWLSRRPLPDGVRGELRVPTGEVVQLRVPEVIGAPAPVRGRPARATAQILRALFYLGVATQAQLAKEAGVSQARVSQVLNEHRDQWWLATDGRRPARWRVTDRQALLEAWLEVYRPARLTMTYWYALTGLREQLDVLVGRLGDDWVLSGAMAADLLAPWAIPERIRVYASAVPDLTAAGFVPSLSAEASLEVALTSDRSVMPSARAQQVMSQLAPGLRVPLADPLVMIWDVLHSGQLDAEQASSMLAQRVARATGALP